MGFDIVLSGQPADKEQMERQARILVKRYKIRT